MKNPQIEKIKNTTIETKIIGWTGSLLIITAYSLNSLQHLPSDNIIYPILNILGASMMGYRVFKNKNWSNLFLEIFWIIIAIISIINIIHF